VYYLYPSVCCHTDKQSGVATAYDKLVGPMITYHTVVELLSLGCGTIQKAKSDFYKDILKLWHGNIDTKWAIQNSRNRN